MSATAVPLTTISGAAKVKLFAGLAALLLAGGALAYFGTAKLVRDSLPASALLEHNAKEEGVQVTASGLQYKVLREGKGPKPTSRDIVLVNYEGKLSDGRIFDSSYQRRQPAAFPLRGLIPGWTEGIQLMPTGSKYRFWIPPELGYGAEGAGDGIIPPNSMLIFDVELLEIAPAGE
jgi:FKBP-type peptidyl-prolyl cis-trans isomerase